MSTLDTAGKLSGFTPFEHIFIVKTRLNHAQLRGLPAVSKVVMSQKGSNAMRAKIWMLVFPFARYERRCIIAPG